MQNIYWSRRSLLKGSLATAIVGPSVLRTVGAVAQQATPLNFQLSWLRSIQYGGYFMAAERGIYKKYGIDATFSPGGPNIDSIANVVSGQAALGDRPCGPLIVARDKGFPIKVIGATFQKSPFSIMSLESKPIRSLQELAGKTVAVAPSARPTVTGIIRQAGLDPQKVNIVPAAPDPFALVSGQIDAYTGLSTNQGTMLEARGIKIVSLNLYDLGLPEASNVLYGRADFLDKNRELIVKFLRASIDGWKWALANKEETARTVVEKYGASGLEYDAQLAELKASEPYIKAGRATPNNLLTVDMSAYERLLKLYKDLGLIKTDIKAEELCDPSFINAAHAS